MERRIKRKAQTSNLHKCICEICVTNNFVKEIKDLSFDAFKCQSCYRYAVLLLFLNIILNNTFIILS